jgi:hypothetical protein
MSENQSRSEIFAVNFAALAREIAMDILPLKDILELHKLSDDEWARISANRPFQEHVARLSQEWNSAGNTRERVRIKAATGLESELETYVRDISDPTIPLVQRVEAGKFLARLGELDGAMAGQGSGQAFSINIQIGETVRHVDVTPVRTIEALAIPEDE